MKLPEGMESSLASVRVGGAFFVCFVQLPVLLIQSVERRERMSNGKSIIDEDRGLLGSVSCVQVSPTDSKTQTLFLVNPS